MRSAARACDAQPRACGGGADGDGRRDVTGILYSGTSGFSYATWKGAFYPKTLAGSRMLEYYSSRLNGVELNGSFYRMPTESPLQKWASGVPAGFRFCMKAHRGLTYSAEGFDRVGLARLFAERMTLLGERLGPTLLQFPPTRQRNIPLLDALLEALGRGVASEFRHESWFHDETYEVIRRHSGALVVTDEEKWPQAPLVDLGPMAYFRLRRGYKHAALEPWIAIIKSALAAHDDVHVYFKHDPQAPRLALRLSAAIAGTGSGSRPPRSRPSPARPAAPAAGRR